MGKPVGYFLDENAKKKVRKARALDEALLGRTPDKKASKKIAETFDRLYKNKPKEKIKCNDCGTEESVGYIISVENKKTVTRCYKCAEKLGLR